nr:hypothetical protein [Flavobacterium franklandianum]
MKAIHNKHEQFNEAFEVGNYKLKYNFESNSQRWENLVSSFTGWEL